MWEVKLLGLMGVYTRHHTERMMILIAGRSRRESGVLGLDATFLARPATVVRNWGHILDQLHIQAGCLKRGDGALSSGAGALHANFHVSHSELRGLFGCLLGSTLTCERSTFAASLETACASTGPTKGVALGVCDGHSRVVKRRVNMGDAVGDIAANAFLFIGLCHGKGSLGNWNSE